MATTPPHQYPISDGTSCINWSLLGTPDPCWISSVILEKDPETVFKRSRPKLLLAERLNKARIFSKIKTINKLHPQLCLQCSIYPFLFENHLACIYICVCEKTYLFFPDINVEDKKNNFIVGSTWNKMMFPRCRTPIIHTLTRIIEVESIQSIRQIVN